MMPTKYFVGTSGWHYVHWRGLFYPPDLAMARWLAYYARQFNSVELNNTFYRLPSEKAVIGWLEMTPPDFIFSVKVSRFITHVKRLHDAGEPLKTFTDRIAILGKKLGPLLYQLPENFKRDDVTLDAFLRILPQGLSHVFEFRNSSWFEPPVFALLRRYGAGLCMYDMPETSTPLAVTTDFAYVRFHGNRRLYGSDYSDDELTGWAGRIAGLDVRKVFIYFNNDAEAFAVKNAKTIERMLSQPSFRA